MLVYTDTIDRLVIELDELKEVRAAIQTEGETAPAQYTIDSARNGKGVTYHRLKDGKKMIRSLGRGGEDLRDWRDRIQRRNAIQTLDSHAMQIRTLIESLSKGIDYSLNG